MQIHLVFLGKTIRYIHVCVYEMRGRELNFALQRNIWKYIFLTEIILGLEIHLSSEHSITRLCNEHTYFIAIVFIS